jgi:hypothetical protein
LEEAKKLTSDETSNKLLTKTVARFKENQLKEFDTTRLIRIILALQQENDQLRVELEKLQFMSTVSTAFKVDRDLKYGLRESHRLFVELLNYLGDVEDDGTSYEAIQLTQQVLTESAIVPKLQELLSSLNLKAELAEKNFNDLHLQFRDKLNSELKEAKVSH